MYFLQAYDYSPSFEEDPMFLPNNLIPLNYIVKINPFPSDNSTTFEGYTEILFKVVQPTSEISFHVAYLDAEWQESKVRLVLPGSILVP